MLISRAIYIKNENVNLVKGARKQLQLRRPAYENPNRHSQVLTNEDYIKIGQIFKQLQRLFPKEDAIKTVSITLYLWMFTSI